MEINIKISYKNVVSYQSRSSVVFCLYWLIVSMTNEGQRQEMHNKTEVWTSPLINTLDPLLGCSIIYGPVVCFSATENDRTNPTCWILPLVIFERKDQNGKEQGENGRQCGSVAVDQVYFSAYLQ